MHPEARNIYNAIQKRLLQSSCQAAPESNPEVTGQPAAVQAVAFPPGLGDARMRWELESYFRVHCFSWGYDDSDAGDFEDYEFCQDDQVQEFEFVDPETLRTRPENLTRDDADRWDMFEAENYHRRNYYEPIPTPAEIDYRASLVRLDRRTGLKYGTGEYGDGEPGLLEQFMSLTPTELTPETIRRRGCTLRKTNTFEALAR